MSANPFLPQANAVCINTSTTSNSIALPGLVTTTMLVTNRSSSTAWVSWSSTSPPTAVFPTAGDTTGVQGVEVPPTVQIAIGVNGQASYVSAVLLSGTGVMTFVPGDGL